MSTLPAVSSPKGARLGEAFGITCLLIALAISPWMDRLTNVLLLLTTLLFAAVTRYARRYLAGDPRQNHFTLWLCITGCCVFSIILVENLLLFVVAWSATSFSLHHLLQFYKDRPAAIMAARKKFLISRLGDICLISVLILTHKVFGSWDFDTIFAAATRLRAQAGPIPLEVHAICLLLAFAALLKSAQFPFHSWLPDTMETPTPVSALMHAGIINAGGILVMRLHELLILSEPALALLSIVGAFTALFAAIVMLTQASVKRCLAFSTVGQMGFMMLECGLGAFHLALLHLVAHSLYKAHAFLSTGGIVQMKQPRYATPASPLVILLGLATALATSFVIGMAIGVDLKDQTVLTGIFTLAMAQMLWTSWTTLESRWMIVAGMAGSALFATGYFALDRLAGVLITPHPHGPKWVEWPILIVFTLAALLQSQMNTVESSAWGQKLFVHARNGFYCNTLANRFTAWVWPVSNPSMMHSKGIL